MDIFWMDYLLRWVRLKQIPELSLTEIADLA